MQQSVRHVWLNPDLLEQGPDVVGYMLRDEWAKEADILIVMVGDREKCAAFEDRLWMYGPGEPDLTSPSATPSSESPESGSSDHPRPRKAGERSR